MWCWLARVAERGAVRGEAREYAGAVIFSCVACRVGTRRRRFRAAAGVEVDKRDVICTVDVGVTSRLSACAE